MSPWRDGSLYPLARGCRAPRRIMPELEATAPAIRASRSRRLDGAAAAGRTMVRSTSAAVAGFVLTIDIAGRTSRVMLAFLLFIHSLAREGRTAMSQFGANDGARAFGAIDRAAPRRRRAPPGGYGVIANARHRKISAIAPARPLSPTSRAKSAASRPTRTRRLAALRAGRCRNGGMVLFIPWRCRAPRRIMPELEATAPAIRRPARADWSARRLAERW